MPYGDGSGPWWGARGWSCPRGMGHGRGAGRGFGRGWGFQSGAWSSGAYPNPGSSKEQELSELEAILGSCQAEIESIKRRIAQLKGDPGL